MELGMEGRWQWNSLSAEWLDSYSLAYTVSSLLNQLFGKGKEPFWQRELHGSCKSLIKSGLHPVFRPSSPRRFHLCGRESTGPPKPVVDAKLATGGQSRRPGSPEDGRVQPVEPALTAPRTSVPVPRPDLPPQGTHHSSRSALPVLRALYKRRVR